MRFRAFIIGSISFVICSAGLSAQAAGVGVRPSTLTLAGAPYQIATTEMLIMNTGDEPAVYSLRADDQAGRLQFSPEAFSLDPNGSQLVIVTGRPGLLRQQATVSVVARPLGATVAAAGVKVPVTLIATGFGWQLAGASGLIILIIGLGAFFIWRRRYQH